MAARAYQFFEAHRDHRLDVRADTGNENIWLPFEGQEITSLCLYYLLE